MLWGLHLSDLVPSSAQAADSSRLCQQSSLTMCVHARCSYWPHSQCLVSAAPCLFRRIWKNTQSCHSLALGCSETVPTASLQNLSPHPIFTIFLLLGTTSTVSAISLKISSPGASSFSAWMGVTVWCYGPVAHKKQTDIEGFSMPSAYVRHALKQERKLCANVIS